MGSNLSLHRQFVFSFNKPRQSYYTNPILWSILMAMFCSWLQGIVLEITFSISWTFTT